MENSYLQTRSYRFFSPGTTIGMGGLVGCGAGGLIYGGPLGAGAGTLVGLLIPTAKYLVDKLSSNSEELLCETMKTFQNIQLVLKIFACSVLASCCYYFSLGKPLLPHQSFSQTALVSYGTLSAFYLSTTSAIFLTLKMVSNWEIL
jgi:hypothetical protein